MAPKTRTLKVISYQVVIIILISYLAHKATASINDVQQQGSKAARSEWSVELASVTTLPPPSKMLAAFSSSLSQQQQQQHRNHQQARSATPSSGISNQESLFDDSPQSPSQAHLSPPPSDLSTTFARYDHTNQPTSNYLTGPLDFLGPNYPSFVTQPPPVVPEADFTTKWTPSHYALPAAGRAPMSPEALHTIEPPTLGRPGDQFESEVTQPSKQQKQPYITLNALSRHFGGPLQLPGQKAQGRQSLPGDTIVSQDLLRRALAIKEALQYQQPIVRRNVISAKLSERKLFTPSARSWQQVAAPRWSADLPLVLTAHDSQEDPVGGLHSSPVYEHLAAPSPTAHWVTFEHPLERDHSARHSQASSALENGHRSHSKLEAATTYEPSASQTYEMTAPLMTSASHRYHHHHHHPHATPTLYFASAYPMPVAYHHHHKGALRHDKAGGLLKPVLIGILAALLSFLIISNLFLSIPLFAMTLFQLISGAANMMMMPNQSQLQAPPANMPANNNNQPQMGRRRRRRNAWMHFADQHDYKSLMALAAIGSTNFS